MADSVFCQLPWVSLAIRNNGDYRVCCHANTSPGRGLLQGSGHERLNAATTGLDEARNSETLKKIRRNMLEGRWPESCVRCQREEASGMRSKRIYSRDMLPSQFDETWARALTESDGSLPLDRAPLVDMDVRFGNKCNLACRMCGPSDSSSWIDDHEKLGRRFEATGFDWHEKPAFWESLESRARDLRHIYIVGGEPLLIDRHYRFLRHLIDIGQAPQVTLEY
ncbi:MAG TPA: twitch domain-containing radical SAM protein, partial [Pseudobdellovibrionaceae bacterium]|nr:twitch domain-containing radical SAM protein [Pseudobdellovibrionaceae bacterium]